MPVEKFRDYCDRVLSHIPRATERERQEIREELLDHLLEHRDMLVDHGTDILEAEKQAIEAMGNAGEIGRLWNDQLSPVWLWVGRICKTACILLVVCSLQMAVYTFGGVIDNLYIRNAVPVDEGSHRIQGYEPFWTQELDIREPFGEHIIRLYRAELLSDKAKQGLYYLKVYMVSYPQNPFHYALNSDIMSNYILCGEERSWGGSSGGGGTGYSEWEGVFQVTKGQRTADITMDYAGESFAVELTLDWGGVAE